MINTYLPGYKAFYSTPSNFINELQAESDNLYFVKLLEQKYAIYEGDFFPYADNNVSYWTGFYSSNPEIKLHARQSAHYLFSSQKLLALFSLFQNSPQV